MDKLAKPWRTRSRIVSNAGTALWTPKGDFRWCSAAGANVVLAETNLSLLSNPERRILQRLALFKLQTLSINCTIPSKGHSKNFGQRLKKSLYRRKRSMEGGFSLFDKLSGGGRSTGVFATSLETVIKNDKLAAAGIRPAPRQTRRKSEPTALSPEAREKVPRRRRASANTPPTFSALKRQNVKKHTAPFTRRSASSTSLRSAGSSQDGDYLPDKRHSDSDSIIISNDNTSRTKTTSKLLDALTLNSTTASASCLLEKPRLPIPSPPQVPAIVIQSIKYLETHGLHALGIFRVAGSKKRLKQLRDEFDMGLKETFSEEDNAHDVAALFKEFLRCLPEPLLTRELYSPFLSTQKFEDADTQLNALKYLWYLLPGCNRDTLQCLLEFLSKVAKCSEDTTDENNQTIPGNKMSCRNLATLMGPNILHKMRSQNAQNFVVESAQRAEENTEVIDVTEDLITYQDQLSTVSPEMHDQVMRILLKTEPETVDFILKRKAKVHLDANIENIIKGSDDLINELDDKEINARLAHRVLETRTQSVPSKSVHYTTKDDINVDKHCNNRCSSLDAQFVKNFGLNPDKSSDNTRRMQKQRPYCTHSEPATPKIKYSVSYTYFTPPPSPDSPAFISSSGNSPNSSVSYSSTDPYEETNPTNGHQEDTSSVSESTADSYITNEDFNDLDMRRQWLEWEALSKNVGSNEDFLDQETLV